MARFLEKSSLVGVRKPIISLYPGRVQSHSSSIWLPYIPHAEFQPANMTKRKRVAKKKWYRPGSRLKTCYTRYAILSNLSPINRAHLKKQRKTELAPIRFTDNPYVSTLISSVMRNDGSNTFPATLPNIR